MRIVHKSALFTGDHGTRSVQHYSQQGERLSGRDAQLHVAAFEQLGQAPQVRAQERRHGDRGRDGQQQAPRRQRRRVQRAHLGAVRRRRPVSCDKQIQGHATFP